MEDVYSKLIELALDWNEKINITAIKDPEEFYKKNILDSLAIKACPQFEDARTVMDLGTGGGYPGLPLAIAYPNKSFLLVDSVGKKLKVVEDIIDKLGISNASTLHSRAEDLSKEKLFDCVVSRAVSNMSVLCEYCLPFVKKGGVFIAYKTEDAKEEVDAAAKAIKLLGGELEQIVSDGVEGSGHLFVVVRKVKDTPAKYPRKAGDPLRKPL